MFGTPRTPRRAGSFLPPGGSSDADTYFRSSRIVRDLATGENQMDVRSGGARGLVDASTVLQEHDVGSQAGAAPLVGDLPPHLWRVTLTDGASRQLRALAALADGRVVAAVRSGSGSSGGASGAGATAVGVYDSQLTRAAGSPLVSPVEDAEQSVTSSGTCTAVVLAPPDTVWCGWA